MHYPDLKSYHMYDDIYPNMLNIGWLDKSYDFPKGKVSRILVEKLRYLTLLAKEQDMFRYTHPSGIVIHSGLVRGPIFKCPYCEEKIGLFEDSDQSDNPNLKQRIFRPFKTQSVVVGIGGIDDKEEENVYFLREFDYPYNAN